MFSKVAAAEAGTLCRILPPRAPLPLDAQQRKILAQEVA